MAEQPYGDKPATGNPKPDAEARNADAKQNPDNPYARSKPEMGNAETTNKETQMNQDQMKGKFQQMKGKLKEAFGQLTDDDIALYDGQREQFFGKLHEKCGIEKDEAEKRIKKIEEASKKAA